MRLRNIVRSDNEAIVVGHLGHEVEEQALVGGPSAARDDAFASLDELFDLRERLGLTGNGSHAVEAGVATHGDIRQTIGRKQLCRGIVLYKEMGHMMELAEKPGTIPTEEIGIGTEDERDVEQRYARIFQRLHVVEPKLVLDENGGHERVASHPLGGMTGRVGR